MDLAKLLAWSSPGDGCHQRRPWCGHRGAAAQRLLLGFLPLPTSAVKALPLPVERPCCHHLPLLSGSPDLGARLCLVLHRPIESQPTHRNSPDTFIRDVKELYKGYKPLS